MDFLGIWTSMIHHVNHAMEHLPITGATVLRYESGYTTHNVTNTVDGTTLCRSIMLSLYLLEVQNFVRQRGDWTGCRHPGAEARKQDLFRSIVLHHPHRCSSR
jgi:hypothetical protein